MTSRWMSRPERWRLSVNGRWPDAVGPDRLVDAGPATPTAPAGGPDQLHQVLVCVRLTPAAPGNQLLEFLRSEPCAVGAWWIATDIDAVVQLSSVSAAERRIHTVRAGQEEAVLASA